MRRQRERLLKSERDNIVFHGVEIEDGRPADVQGETAYLAKDFSSTGLVPIILCTPRNELGNDVPIQFIRHIAQKIPDGNAALARTPLVHDTVGISRGLAVEGCRGTRRVSAEHGMW